MSEHSTENGLPANYLAPDGYRYGVMFGDGSLSERWNGRTQRENAEREVARLADDYAPDRITLARCRPGEPWERVIPSAMPKP